MSIIIVSKYVKASRKSTLVDVFLATLYIITNHKARFSLTEISAYSNFLRKLYIYGKMNLV